MTSSWAWAHVRAVVVTAHVCAIFLSAFPSPEGGLDRKNWAQPTVQAEFRMWSERLSMPQAEFEERLWTFATTWQGALNVVLRPIGVYEEALGTEQSWKMFVAPHRFPSRMQIQVRVDENAWETVFEERSPTARWRASVFGHERVRSAIFRWSWPSYLKSWRMACSALARVLFAERAEVEEVRCRFRGGASPSAAQVLAGEVPPSKWSSTWVVRRDAGDTPTGASSP